MERIRVLTANLWNTRIDVQGFSKSLRYLDPDVVCLQELDSLAAGVVDDLYPYGELTSSDDFRGMGIAMRRPGKVSQLELPAKNGLIAVLEPDDWPSLSATLEIVNLHLAAPGPRRIPSQLAIRRKQILLLEEYLRIAPDRARLVVGDLNATPLWPLYRRLNRHLSDVHRRIAKQFGRRPRRTWGPTHEWPRLLRIDHVFSRDVEVSDLWVVPIPGSDHSGVIFDLA